MKRMQALSRTASARRGGAVIIVVLALLSLMLFLGVFFFEFAQEEQQTSDAFIGANPDEVVNPDPITEEALRQRYELTMRAHDELPTRTAILLHPAPPTRLGLLAAGAVR